MRKVINAPAVKDLAKSNPGTYGDDAPDGRKKRWTVLMGLNDLLNSGGYTLVDTEDLIYIRRFITQLLSDVNREYYKDNDWWIRRLDIFKAWLEEDSPIQELPPVPITGIGGERRVLTINEILQRLQQRYPKATPTQWAGVLPFYHNLRKAGMIVAEEVAGVPPFDGAIPWNPYDEERNQTWVCEVRHVPEKGYEVLRWIVHEGGMRHSIAWVPAAEVIANANYPDRQLLIVRKKAEPTTKWVHWSEAVNLRHASGRKIAGVGRQNGNPYYWFYEGDVATEPERIEINDNDNWKIEVMIEDD